MKFPSQGLYAITQVHNKSPETIHSEVKAALTGGAAVIQYRDKSPVNAEILAQKLVKLCHQFNVPFIVNDDIDLAIKVSADGVHLGKNDSSVHRARKLLGNKAIIGISCYDDLQKALQMQKAGVNYVAFGRFFPSNSKPLASPAQISTLQQAKTRLSIPVVAIGGILPENGGQLLTAGADVLAVIGGVFDKDPLTAARSFQRLFVHTEIRKKPKHNEQY